MTSVMHDVIAPSTRKVYSAGVRLFKSFCKSHALRHLPASELTIRLFCTAQSTRVSYPVSAVRMFHLERGLQDPTADAPLLALVLHGPNLNSRQHDNSSAPTPCVGFSLTDLPPSSTVLGGFHVGLLRVSPGAFLRVSEYTSRTRTKASPSTLPRNNLTLQASTITIRLHKSKTSQYRSPPPIFIAADTCPVAALQQYLSHRRGDRLNIPHP